MAMRGVGAATKFHQENTGLPYFPLVLKKDGEQVIVRVLQSEDEWVSLFMHRDFKAKIGSTRCADQNPEPNMDDCLLCAHGVARSLRTFIPVRLRGEENQAKVHIVDYGRNHLMEVLNQIEELGEKHITDLDFKIKRKGSDTDTTYRWVPAGNERPLNDDEKALVIPNIDELVQVPNDAKMKSLAAKLGSDDDDDDDARTAEKDKGGGKYAF